MKKAENKKARALARIIAKRTDLDEKTAYRKLSARLPKLGKLLADADFTEYLDGLERAVSYFGLKDSDTYKLITVVTEWVAYHQPQVWHKIEAERVA